MRPGEGKQKIHDVHVAEMARYVEARVAFDTIRHEQKGGYRIPARIDQGLYNLKMPVMARDTEARASVVCCLEEKRLPARLDQGLRNLQVPLTARDKKASDSVICCLE